MDYPKVKVCLDTSEDNLIDELYTPCLKWAERFDRGVGYFTTGWLTYNVAGLSDFASRGGKMRLITSPILSTEDTDAIIGAENQDGSAFLRLEAALLENVEILKQEMEADIINTFSWMLYDGIIDMRFAIPCEKLEEGDFHDKFGIFYKGNDALSFSGSINDSKHGFQNYESIKVFKTWAGTQEYVDADTARFEKIWNRKDRNLKMFTIPQAVKNKIFELRSPDRPYSLPAGSSKWVHQDIAVKTFLEKEHGILAMATGTGKTVTAMKIIRDVHINGNLDEAVNEGVRRGYEKAYLRKSITADPLQRVNTGDNTPAFLTVHLVPGDVCKITVAPKGAGSENMSRLTMLKPADGVQGVKDFVMETVKQAGANPCPPIVLGIGIGGSFDKCAALAKKALLRPLDQPNADPYYAALEKELLDAINATGFGPQGFGGATTCLGVCIEQLPTHVACLPVAVNVSCHVTRRASAEV